VNREVIPAIDLMEGKCVRLEQGDFNRARVYRSDPLNYAREMEDRGIRMVHVVDLDGAREGKTVQDGVLKKICEATNLKVDFGGGIRSNEDLRRVLDAGASHVSLSSAVVLSEKRFDSWVAEYGADTFILCPDFSDNRVRISGWTEDTGMMVEEFIGRFLNRGIRKFLCTDIRRDGMMSGPAFGLYRKILRDFSGIRLIASGGVGGKRDVEDLFDLGVSGVVVGRALYEGAVTLNEISQMGRC